MITIKTNHHARPILQAYELTEKELKEFDYLEGDSLDQANFFRYRGTCYDLGQFVRIKHKGCMSFEPFAHFDHSGDLKGWDGIMTDSFFSGIVVKYTDDNESLIVGLALS